MHAKPKHTTEEEHEATTTTIVTAIPSSNHHTRTSNRRTSNRRKCICICTTLTILAIALIILILALTVFKSKKPITSVNSVAINDINATINLIPLKISINISLDIKISVKNPNKIGITYHSSSAALRYKGRDVGSVPIPAGKIGSGDTKQMNLTVTVFADRLLSDVDLYGDVISGNFLLTSYTRIHGKVRVLNLFNIHVSSTSTCDLKIDVLNRKIVYQRCHYKSKL